MKICCKVLSSVLGIFLLGACEILDDKVDGPMTEATFLRLDDVAEILASVPLQTRHVEEVFDAARASSDNGYDEEYTMRHLFEAPGCGVGGEAVGAKSVVYENPLRDLISDYLRQHQATKSGEALPLLRKNT